MSANGPSAHRRAVRAAVQELESLQRAGLTHLPKPPMPPPAAAQAVPAQTIPAQTLPAQAAPAPEASPGPRDDRVAALASVARTVAACTRCPELARTRTQTVFGSGSPSARLVFMGEAPGADEDRQGLPFVGAAGQKLTDMIEKGMRLRREEVYILNTIKCRPPGNRAPLPDEAANCREYLDAQLDVLRPEFLCCLGAVAAQNLLGVSTPIGQLRGSFHDYQGIKVLCTYHPAYLLRTPSAKVQAWDDLKLLMAAMGLEVPKKST